MAIISPYAFFQELDNNGAPLAGGKLYTYEAGTTTNKATFTTEGESASNTNPIILDSSGRADVWLGSGSYKFVLKTSADVLVKEVDGISGDTSAGFGSVVTTVATNTSVTAAYLNNIVLCTATLTLSLLSSSEAGEGFIFVVKNTGLGIVTIDPDGSETIDGAASITLSSGQWATVVCDGTNWVSVPYELPLGKDDATTAPGVSNDDTEGYVVGSEWIDVTAGIPYICLDPSTGAAVWEATTVADGSITNAKIADATIEAAKLTAAALTEIREIPQNSKSAAYTLVLADGGKHILHPSADTTARIFTIPANASVAYPIGTAVTFVNQDSAGVVTIAITSDTMRLADAGTTGSRTLAANGFATALKVTSTEWIISGAALT